ncbi:MAG: SHOCT domain-containing protein [Ignavibacteriae bacterium]|nr:MAG: SHOCT domain-containing protein [Ignavibacteriota bacterium]
MGPENFGFGGWWIIPVICMIAMFFFMMFRRGGFRPPWGQNSDRHQSESKDSESAIDILKKRYARGEITKDEFDQMKKDL